MKKIANHVSILPGVVATRINDDKVPGARTSSDIAAYVWRSDAGLEVSYAKDSDPAESLVTSGVAADELYAVLRALASSDEFVEDWNADRRAKSRNVLDRPLVQDSRVAVTVTGIRKALGATFDVDAAINVLVNDGRIEIPKRREYFLGYLTDDQADQPLNVPSADYRIVRVA